MILLCQKAIQKGNAGLQLTWKRLVSTRRLKRVRGESQMLRKTMMLSALVALAFAPTIHASADDSCKRGDAKQRDIICPNGQIVFMQHFLPGIESGNYEVNTLPSVDNSGAGDDGTVPGVPAPS
jgi:hypothetical protein